MDPLQIASLTTALAPLATRTLSGLVNAVTPEPTFRQALANSTTRDSTRTASATSGADSDFQGLYQDLQNALEKILKQFPGIKDSIELEVDPQGRFHVRSPDHPATSQLEQWLNQQHDLNELAASTVDAKQRWQWNSGAPAPTESVLHLRINPAD